MPSGSFDEPAPPDSNIIHQQPGSRIEAHAGPDHDVLLHVLHGDGQLMTEVSTLALRPGILLWLPRLSGEKSRPESWV